MTWPLASLLSISLILPSMKLCRSLAASYSAFSERSPCVRASAIAVIALGRSTVFRRCNSCRSSSAPVVVSGIVLMAVSTKKPAAAPGERQLRHRLFNTEEFAEDDLMGPLFEPLCNRPARAQPGMHLLQSV